MEAALERMGLGGREDLPAKTLSQGQQRRLALARLLIGEHALWILDEPLAALDSTAVRLVQAVIEEHLQDGGLAVLTTHQPLDVRARQTRQIHLAPLSGH
jgi:heme exporter protein A